MNNFTRLLGIIIFYTFCIFLNNYISNSYFQDYARKNFNKTALKVMDSIYIHDSKTIKSLLPPSTINEESIEALINNAHDRFNLGLIKNVTPISEEVINTQHTKLKHIRYVFEYEKEKLITSFIFDQYHTLKSFELYSAKEYFSTPAFTGTPSYISYLNLAYFLTSFGFVILTINLIFNDKIKYKFVFLSSLFFGVFNIKHIWGMDKFSISSIIDISLSMSSFYKNFYTPITLETSFPIGAIIYLLIRKKLLHKNV